MGGAHSGKGGSKVAMILLPKRWLLCLSEYCSAFSKCSPVECITFTISRVKRQTFKARKALECLENIMPGRTRPPRAALGPEGSGLSLLPRLLFQAVLSVPSP